MYETKTEDVHEDLAAILVIILLSQNAVIIQAN